MSEENNTTSSSFEALTYEPYKVYLLGKAGVCPSVFRCVSEYCDEPTEQPTVRYSIPGIDRQILLINSHGLDSTIESLTYDNPYRNASCIVFVYDTTDSESLYIFDEVFRLLMRYEQDASTRFVLFRNRIDEPSTRVNVTLENEEQFVKSHSDTLELRPTKQTSTSNKEHITKFFHEDIKEVLQYGVSPMPQEDHGSPKSFCSRLCACIGLKKYTS